jgi:hypothetical protein
MLDRNINNLKVDMCTPSLDFKHYLANYQANFLISRQILNAIYTAARSTTEDYPEGVYAYWRDGFNFAVNYSSEEYNMNILETAKILIGKKQ